MTKIILHGSDLRDVTNVTLPEEPEYCTDFGDIILLCANTLCKCNNLLKKYRYEYQQAIESAPIVKNKEEVIQWMWEDVCTWADVPWSVFIKERLVENTVYSLEGYSGRLITEWRQDSKNEYVPYTVTLSLITKDEEPVPEPKNTEERLADTTIRLAKEIGELEPLAAELRSLKQSILESPLKEYFPAKEMSFHDKVVLAVHKLYQAKIEDEEPKQKEETD